MREIYISISSPGVRINFGDVPIQVTSRGKLTNVRGSPTKKPDPANGSGIFDIGPSTNPPIVPKVWPPRCQCDHTCLPCCYSRRIICPNCQNPPICCAYSPPLVHNWAWDVTARCEKEQKKEAEEIKLRQEKEKEEHMGREAVEIIRQKQKLMKESARLDKENTMHEQNKKDWKKKIETLNLD